MTKGKKSLELEYNTFIMNEFGVKFGISDTGHCYVLLGIIGYFCNSDG